MADEHSGVDVRRAVFGGGQVRGVVQKTVPWPGKAALRRRASSACYAHALGIYSEASSCARAELRNFRGFVCIMRVALPYPLVRPSARLSACTFGVYLHHVWYNTYLGLTLWLRGCFMCGPDNLRQGLPGRVLPANAWWEDRQHKNVPA